MDNRDKLEKICMHDLAQAQGILGIMVDAADGIGGGQEIQENWRYSVFAVSELLDEARNHIYEVIDNLMEAINGTQGIGNGGEPDRVHS